MPKPKNPDAVISDIAIDKLTVTVSTTGTKPAPSSSLARYQIDYGDGTVVGHSGKPPNPLPAYAYAAPGSYEIVLTVWDKNQRSDKDSRLVTVVHAEPEPPEPEPQPPDPTPIPPAGRLLTRANLKYLGAFRLPAVDGYSYYTRGLAYNTKNNSLFTGGGYTPPPGAAHIEKVSEISIPDGITADYASMPTAAVLQPLTDVTEGRDYHLGAGGADLEPTHVTIHRGGLHVFNGTLIGTAYVEYDAAAPQAAKLSHFRSSLELKAAGDFQGAFTVGNLGAAVVAGYLCDIPPEWRERLGGPCLTGQGTLAVIIRTSAGPSFHVFDPDVLTGPTAAAYPATPLTYYDQAHQTLGSWLNIFPDDPAASANKQFNAASMMGGAVFPVGTDSVLVFGNIGYGIPGYGISTVDAALDRTPVPGQQVPGQTPVYYILDRYNISPDGSGSHGTHAWPYVNQVWCYNANDLYAVKQGTKQPWEVVPYDLWDLSDVCPIHDGAAVDQSFGAGLAGAAYDPQTQRIFVPQGDGAERWVPGVSPYSYNPLIRVFQVEVPAMTGPQPTITC